MHYNVQKISGCCIARLHFQGGQRRPVRRAGELSICVCEEVRLFRWEGVFVKGANGDPYVGLVSCQPVLRLEPCSNCFCAGTACLSRGPARVC